MEPGIVRRPPFGANPLVGERGSDTRRRVLASALEVFGETAFSEARVEQITERAGCSRPAFYQYFSSKDDVFWALATDLGQEMVELTDRLERVTPDRAGVAHLVDWIGEFMSVHESWAPVFASFPAASRGRAGRLSSSGSVSDRTSRSLLRAFGVRRSAADERLAATLVAVLIRCSFYAEQAPRGTDRGPLEVALAELFHRCLSGPLDDVNIERGVRSRRRRIRIAAPAEPAPEADLPARGARTRQRLLDAGSVVIPERGYHDARVDDVVAAAGVSHGTFYRYFDGKDDFFRALADAASARLIELVDRLVIDAPEPELRAWVGDWFEAYEADGGVISTWQEMRTSPELAAFSQLVAASVFTRLERLLDRRDFGGAQVDAAMLLALLERSPYRFLVLGFSTRDQAIDATVEVIRRGFLGVDGVSSEAGRRTAGTRSPAT